MTARALTLPRRPHVDARVENHGSIILLRPITSAADAWINESIGPDALTWGGAVVVEPRHLDHIVIGMVEDGLVVD